MSYNFDEIIDRKGTGCLKYEVLERDFGRTDLLPLWIADLDFATPDFVVEALEERMKHPIFGYTTIPEDYFQTIIDWNKSHHQWNLKREWLSYIPGIVKGIGLVINCFLKEGDKVVIQPPVYHPFRIVPEENGFEVVYNPLILHDDGSYSMDFGNLGELLKDEKCRLLILSNPHNPGGITWDRKTLETLAEVCYAHNVLVISDEIHCDMALFGNRHIPFATVSDKAAGISFTFAAPSKTFNIAGIVSSYSVVPNDRLCEPFYKWLNANEFGNPTIFAPIATIAAFRKGEDWRRQMLHYVEENILAVEKVCKESLPGIKPLRPQASFLVWLDCRGLGLNHEELVNLFVNKAHLALNDGAMFGKEGSGFMRLNVGCPHSILMEAMDRLVQVCSRP